MGLLKFALVGNYKRFYNDLKELSKTNGKSPILMFVDTAVSTIILKSGLQDYLNYKFYEKSFKQRKEYVTIGYMNKMYKTLASLEYANFISNKVNFHKNYNKFVKRKCVSSNSSYEEFEKFLNKNKEFVSKPLRGLGGGNVEKVVTEEIKDRKEFYKKIKEEEFFIEELIVQNEEWSRLSPKSINTLRIMTTAVNGKSKIIFGAARIGSGKNITDNFHQGGIGVLINLDTGKLTGKGIDKKLNETETSITGVKLDGIEIPYWEEIKKMVLEAALVNDKINMVGWDVAIGKDGPLIIEGNRGPGFDLVQVLLGKGTKYMLADLLKEVKMFEKQENKKK